MSKYFASLLLILPVFLLSQESSSEDQESNYYQIQPLQSPDGAVLEVGGLAFLPNEKLAVLSLIHI